MQCALLLHLVIDFPYSTPASAVNLSGDRTKGVGKDVGSKSTELGRYSIQTCQVSRRTKTFRNGNFISSAEDNTHLLACKDLLN